MKIATQSVVQVAAKRLNHRKIDATVGGVHRHTRNKVEIAVTAFNIVVFAVQVVQTHQVQQLGVLDFLTQKGVREFPHPRFVVVIFNLEHKILSVKLIGIERINVLHHQVPVGIFGCEVAAFQKFDNQVVGVGDAVAGELTNLVTHSIDGVLEGHGQNLVAVERRVQRDVAQLRVDGVLVAVQFAGVLNLLVVAGAGKPLIGKSLGHLVDVAHVWHSQNLLVKRVGIVVGRTVAHKADVRIQHGAVFAVVHLILLTLLAQIHESHNVMGVLG